VHASTPGGTDDDPSPAASTGPAAGTGPGEGRLHAGALTRRRLLLGGGLLAAGVVGLALDSSASELPGATARPGSIAAQALGAAPRAAPAAGSIRVERVRSTARGRTIDLVTIWPTAARTPGLPVCLALHGLHSTARAVAVSGLADSLARAVAAHTVPPFVLVAVDGGDSYWHQNQPGDDPMAMLLTEVPGWLSARGLPPAPVAVQGTSMGGFGALYYARRRFEDGAPVRAVGVVAPALITTWAEMSKRNAFHSAADWASYDPLLHEPESGPAALGLWCGTEDKFIAGARRFIAYDHPTAATLARGGHDDSYFRHVYPDVIRFIGTHL
jgi:S-formylglutathione hydrolase FrmB